MDGVDVVVRVAGCTLLTTLACLTLRDRPRAFVSWLFVGFSAGVCGFLAGNTPEPHLALNGVAATTAALLGQSTAVFLWWFGLSAFDEDFRLEPLHIGVGAIWFANVALIHAGWVPDAAERAAAWLQILLGLGIVGHLGWRLLSDWRGDLIERRRRARLVLAGLSGALLSIDLVVDAVLGLEWRPQAFTITQNGAVLAVSGWVAAWLLRADAALLIFDDPTNQEVSAKTGPSPQGRVSSRLLRRLTVLTESERIHRDPNLTFAAFSRKMGVSEKETRRLINQELGFRHFRSFLNASRLTDAREALVDPSKADARIVDVAFEAGFASLASFNRTFKLVEGCSPTEFRKACLEAYGSGEDTTHSAEPAAG